MRIPLAMLIALPQLMLFHAGVARRPLSGDQAAAIRSPYGIGESGGSRLVPQGSDSLLPTVALHALHEELAQSGRSAQREIATRLLRQTRRGGLQEAERFALAELHFAAFDPEGADAGFEGFASRTDLPGRIATQRRFRIQMAAFDAYAGAELRIREARARLPAVAWDPWHLQSSVSTLAKYHADRGEHDVVVRLVREELAALPVDVVFFSHSLPGEYLTSFEAEGLGAEAIGHMQQVRAAIGAGGPRSARGEIPPAAPHREGVIHRLEEGLLRDLPPVEADRFLRGRLFGFLSGYLARAARDTAAALRNPTRRFEVTLRQDVLRSTCLNTSRGASARVVTNCSM